MSSRNVRLQGDDRQRALALRHGLDAARDAIVGGEREASRIEAAGRAAMERDGIEPEYFAVVNARSLAPLERVIGEVLVAVAARVGPVRLIDNDLIQVS
jgi:pantoate--beta-alanine ligase